MVEDFNVVSLFFQTLTLILMLYCCRM